jgi:diketogulonate reductase-like aldo/keto reductase
MESPFPKNYKITEISTCPIIGQGSSGMNYSEISEIIYNSIKLGNRLIDTASVYNSEKGIGLGIKKALNEKICKREDLFIITKFYVQSRNNP